MGNIFCPPQKDGDTPFVDGDDNESLYGESAGGSCYDAEQEEEDLHWTVHQLAQSRQRKRPLLLSPCSSAASCSALAGGGADDDDEGAEDHRTPSPLPLPRPESIHLLAEHKNRSPFREYELLEVMGSGSMGEVSKVKRKPGSLRAGKRCRRGGGGMGGLTRSARSCSSLHSVDEISALNNFFGAERDQGSLLPTCRRRLVGGVPPSLLGTGLTEVTTTNSDDDEVSLTLTSAPPSREASFRSNNNNNNNRGVANPQSPRSLSPRETRPPRSGPPSRSPSPSYGMAGGRSSALLVMPETLTSTSAAAGGGFLALPRNMSFPCSRSAEPRAPWTGTFGFKRGREGSDASEKEQHRVYYALKSIHLRNLSSESYTIELRNEISILGSLDHPHIVRAIETYEHRRRLYLVLELCTGGDLYARDPYTEREAARIVGSVLSAVAYMHRKGIVHRDLKYENVMFVNTKPGADVKLIDFGLSKKYRPGDPYLKTGVGTIYSMAPEVFRGEYTSQADVWGVGVMAYMLLSSHLPFYGKNRQQIISRIVHGHYHFKGRSWKAVSSSARDFVASLLRRDPDDRPTSAEALDLPWLREKASGNGQESAAAAAMAEPSKTAAMASCSKELADHPPPREQEKAVEQAAMSSLKNFAAYPALKKLALMVIAHRSTCMEIGFLQHIFHKLDVHRAGVVSKSEFEARLADFGYSDEELEPMFAGVDLGGCGLITYTEFLAATIESTGNISTARLTEAFDHFDNDGCGYISVSDLRAVLGKEIPRAYVDRVVDEADLTEDHRISFEEFLSLWC